MDGWRCIIGLGVVLSAFTVSGRALAQTDCIPGVVCITQRQGSRSVSFHVRKLSYGALTVRLDVTGTNLQSTADLPFVRTYEDTTNSLAFVLLPETDTIPLAYRYAYQAQYGRLHARHDDRYRYGLPYASGTARRVVQGYDGTLSHQGIRAIDWAMPVGTPVHAARPGLVVAVSDSLREGRNDRALLDEANYIAIMHRDGTVASYAHLQPESAQVAAGDSVRRGQPIARSGNTGYSTAPHLHFEVFRVDDDLQPQTLPVRFDAEGAPDRGLDPGRWYRAAGS